ncbi:hypothetical protein BDAP_001466 [Binucleata daphniae]
MCIYKNHILNGSWNGCVTYKTKEYKIHAGTIFDISCYNDNIITCSTDRSVCILNKKFDILLQIYDYRNRIFRCGFVTNTSFVEKLLYNNEMTPKHNIKNQEALIFYILTECGNLRIYYEREVIYDYKDLDVNITSVSFYNNSLYLGYDDGSVEEKKIMQCMYITKADLFCVNNDDIIVYHNKQIKNVKIDIKINKVFASKSGKIYFTSYNTLYVLKNNTYCVVNKFAEAIINIYENAIVFAQNIVFTSLCYKEIIEQYNVKNVTSNYKNFFGTRDGFLRYKNIQYKISDDAITGICEKNDNIYLSCRDGHVYILCAKYINAMINKYTNQQITLTPTFRRKYISTHFLEGLFVDIDIFTYYFANNCLIVASFFAKECYYIGFKPKHFAITIDKFYYTKNDELYCVDLDRKKIKIANDFTHCCYNNENKMMCVSTPYHIFFYVNDHISDRLEICEVSVIKTIENKNVVGTLKGRIYFCVYYNNMIVENTCIDTKERVIDLEISKLENKSYLVYLLGNNSIHFVSFDKHESKSIAKVQHKHTYTALHMIRNKVIFMARVDGSIEMLDWDKKEVKKWINVSTMVIHKIAYVECIQKFVIICNDHTFAIVDKQCKIETISNHTGPIIDFVLIDNVFIATLGIDKRLHFVSLHDYTVKQAIKTSVYKPACLVKKDGDLYVFGCGYERYSISKILSGTSN